MQIADIPRVKAGDSVKRQIKDLDSLNQERLLLATRATDLLGYQGLLANVTGEVGHLVKAGEVAETLRMLDIEVLDACTVIDYQMQEAARLTKDKILDGNLDDWTTGYFQAATWQKQKISDYTQPIPEFVLDKAVRIKEKLPNVEFHIQFLSYPKADPFLIVSVGKEIYYVEVWDEPRFEGRADSMPF